MTDIIEGNKLIYCFMNPKHEKEVLTFADWWWDDKTYHTSWNLLMPVVEKINNIKANQHPSMDSVHARRKVINMPICSDIKDVWNNVIQFIQWYNQYSI